MKHTSSIIKSLITYNNKTIKKKIKNSKTTTNKKTYIHKNYNKIILTNTISIFPNYKKFQTILPKKII